MAGTRMTKAWAAIPSVNVNFTSTAVALGGRIEITEPRTVLRMIGEYIVGPTSAPVATDLAKVAVAIGVVSSDAYSVGAGSVPSPGVVDEVEFPWLYWKEHTFYFAQNAADPASQIGSGRFAFDIRSMRKLKPRESLCWVAQYVDVFGAPPMTLSWSNVRVLLAH